MGNRDILYSTRKSIQYYVIPYMGKESETEWIYAYAELIYSAVCLKLTELCNATILW